VELTSADLFPSISSGLATGQEIFIPGTLIPPRPSRAKPSRMRWMQSSSNPNCSDKDSHHGERCQPTSSSNSSESRVWTPFGLHAGIRSHRSGRKPLKIYGGQGRNRTADASLFRAALYQLSYLAGK
jgi:hypothetical protein